VFSSPSVVWHQPPSSLYFAPRTFSCPRHGPLCRARGGALPRGRAAPGRLGLRARRPQHRSPAPGGPPQPPRFLSDDVLRAAAVFLADRAPGPSQPSTSTTRGCSASPTRSGAATSWPPHSVIILTTLRPSSISSASPRAFQDHDMSLRILKGRSTVTPSATASTVQVHPASAQSSRPAQRRWW